MVAKSRLWSEMIPHLNQHQCRVGAAGIRYGSVAYIGFGDGVVTEHVGRAATTHYPVELEFGADQWELFQDGRRTLGSGFEDTDKARAILAESLMGCEIQDLIVEGDSSTVIFDQGLSFRSEISKEPASGFLYSFQAEQSDSWETLDGMSVQA